MAGTTQRARQSRRKSRKNSHGEYVLGQYATARKHRGQAHPYDESRTTYYTSTREQSGQTQPHESRPGQPRHSGQAHPYESRTTDSVKMIRRNGTTHVGQIPTCPSTNARWAGTSPRIIPCRFREHTKAYGGQVQSQASLAQWAGTSPQITPNRFHEHTKARWAGTTPRVTRNGLSRSTKRTNTHADDTGR